MPKPTTVTPIRSQYLDAKRQYPDAIVFFRLGDFYETFDEDAQLVSTELDVVLTSRNVAKGQRIPMAGVPYHAVEGYIAKLIAKGYKVAICEQVSRETVNGLMPREVVRVVTPGTVVEPNLLTDKRNNFLVTVVWDDDCAGIAYVDITTGEFATTQLRDSNIGLAVLRELDRLAPAEVVLSDGGEAFIGQGEAESAEAKRRYPRLASLEVPMTLYPDWRFELGNCRRALLDHFHVSTLAGYGCEELPLATRAAGLLLQYLQEHQADSLAQLTRLSTYSVDSFMNLDTTTRRNLELTETIRDRTLKGSLLGVLDHTLTPMGGRLLRRWVTQPLLDLAALEERLNAVDICFQDMPRRVALRGLLKGFGDLERLTNRIVQGIAGPRELIALKTALERVGDIRRRMAEMVRDARVEGAAQVYPLSGEMMSPCTEAITLISQAIVDDPPATLANGGYIRRGYSAELDQIERSVADAKRWIANLERVERQRTGIKNLKVGYNKVFGYYLEVTNSNVEAVPEDYIRKQTLVNAERYITPELKEQEALVLSAAERTQELEANVFRDILAYLGERADELLTTARAIAHLDVYLALAEVAANYNYVRPELSNDQKLEIVGGRHPVVEQMLSTDQFVPNNSLMTPDAAIHIITGPNMSGKCLRGDTLVFTDRGLLTLEELQPENAPLGEFAKISCGVQGMRGSRRATHFYTGGRQKTIALTTRLGYRLEGTPEHRVWVRFADGREGWKLLGELGVGDVFAIPRKVDLWGQETAIDHSAVASLRGVKSYSLPSQMDADLAYLLGLLVGDGTVTYENSFLLSTADAFIADEFRRIIQRLFGYKVGCKANGKDFVVTSKQIRTFLASLGLGYCQAHEKTVPRAILRAPRQIVVAFLQGLFDADGYAENRYGNVRLATASSRLAHEVQLLLLNMGLIASLHVKRTAHRPSYRLALDGAEAIAFYQQVGFRLPRKQAAQGLASPLRRPNVGGIPHLQGALKQVQAAIVATPDKPVALKHNKSVNSIFYTYIPASRNVSYDKLDELVTYCQQNGVACPELDALLDQRYFYDHVAAIEPGEAEVFDLSVPDGHAYVANGLISHNSTYLRQVALIVLMAQIGSFVPAESAHIGLVDRIFTRVGAQDEISAGQSTFMVEMVELANILNHATQRSLLVLDEIGRGTSTYDGISIAWSVVEFLHNHPQLRPKTLFATHYHELVDLEKFLPCVRNYNVAVTSQGNNIAFTHHIVPGGADRSYGIHVAQMAGLPREVIRRAEELLKELENGSQPVTTNTAKTRHVREVRQLALFPAKPHPVVELLRELDVMGMSPLEALNKLYELQQKANDS
ncbi:MAG: DNA mismatch repair protein MutS [Chloroflexi bacterium]|nr:DNA mismatch repair protein MutS [Chloroflexota bacterium]